MPRLLLLRFNLLLLFACTISATCWGQLRIVNYNTHTGPNAGFSTVMQAIGEESYSGFSKPIDVLLVQEQDDITSSTGSTRQIVDILNSIYGAGVYDSGVQNSNPPYADMRQAIIYNTTTVELIDEIAFGSLSSAGQARQTLRYQIRPTGYDSTADFYVYNNHYKSSTGSDNEARRLVEATAIRNNSDALGEGTSVIYTGDFNMYTSSEDGFQELLSSGAGQAFDPIDEIGPWHNNSSFARWHTQSPCNGSCPSGFTGGGIDDRFDFQLVTGELLDTEGMDYISGSYHTFGNNGSTYNDEINNGNTIVFSGITSFTKTQVLDALHSASDHLPVVADYQLPAFMEAELASTIPTTLNQGQSYNLDLLIRNAANVVTSLGADELNFTYNTTGDLLGGGSGIAYALSSDRSFPITLDTATQGSKSGSIVITSSSLGAANASITIPVSFQVGEGGVDPDPDPDPTVPAIIAQALYPSVADDLNVTRFQFGGAFTTVATPAAGSDAQQLAFSDTGGSGDLFGIVDRNDDLPNTILDDTAGSFSSDTLGIIGATDVDNFFGVVDTENSDNSGLLTAEWTFDISSVVSDLELSIDMAAMGDFEASNDSFLFEVSIDGSAFTTLFEATVDENISQTYTLESGTQVSLNDPLVLDGVVLSNSFQTFAELLGTIGDELTLRFTAMADGGSEAFAFRNIVIEGMVASAALVGDYNGDGTVDMADYVVWRNNLGNTVDAGTGADGNGDGVVDAADYAEWKANFGATASTLVASQTVPEPSTLWLAMAATIGLLGLGAKRSNPRL